MRNHRSSRTSHRDDAGTHDAAACRATPRRRGRHPHAESNAVPPIPLPRGPAAARGDRAVEQAPTARGRGAERQGVRVLRRLLVPLLRRAAPRARQANRPPSRTWSATPGASAPRRASARRPRSAPTRPGRRRTGIFSGGGRSTTSRCWRACVCGARQEADDEQAAARAAAVVPDALRSWRRPAKSQHALLRDLLVPLLRPAAAALQRQDRVAARARLQCDPRGTKAAAAGARPPPLRQPTWVVNGKTPGRPDAGRARGRARKRRRSRRRHSCHPPLSRPQNGGGPRRRAS